MDATLIWIHIRAATIGRPGGPIGPPGFSKKKVKITIVILYKNKVKVGFKVIKFWGNFKSYWLIDFYMKHISKYAHLSREVEHGYK